MKNHWIKKHNNQSPLLIWDFQTALADTIREKYESEYIKVVEIRNVINRKVVASEEPMDQTEEIVWRAND